MQPPPPMDGNTFAALIQTIYAFIAASFSFGMIAIVFTYISTRRLNDALDNFKETYQEHRYKFLMEWIPVKEGLTTRQNVSIDRHSKELTEPNPIAYDTADAIRELRSVGLEQYGSLRVLQLIQKLDRDLDSKLVRGVEAMHVIELLKELNEWLKQNDETMRQSQIIPVATNKRKFAFWK